MGCYEHERCGRVPYIISCVTIVPFMASTFLSFAMFIIVGAWCVTTVTADGRIYWPEWMPNLITYVLLSWPITMIVWRIADFAHNRSARKVT
jgi:hypothetical protein